MTPRRLVRAISSALVFVSVPVVAQISLVRRVPAPPPDEYQIAWKLASATPVAPEAWVRKSRDVVRTRMLPERLFAAATDIRSATGELLIPKDMQLLGIDFRREMVCSVAKGPAGSRTATKRVCLLDEDGNGSFDSFFDRTMGRSTFNTDGHWFIMNQPLDSGRAPVAAVALIPIPSERFDQKLELSLRYASISDRARATFFTARVGNAFFNVPCSAYWPETGAAPIGQQTCDVAGMTVTLAGRRKDELLMRLSGSFADQPVRFGAQQAIGFGRNISEIRFPRTSQ